MRRMIAEPVLNKVSLFLSDVKFRHLLGQQHSTFSLVAFDGPNCWIIVNLDKGRLGEHGATFGSMLLTKTKHASSSERFATFSACTSMKFRIGVSRAAA